MSDERPWRFEARLSAPAGAPGEALWFAFRRRELLLGDAGGVPRAESPEALGLRVVRRQYLGELDGVPCYSAELDEASEAPSGTTFASLRGVYGRLGEAERAVAARAVQIVDWDRTHQFCGACGTQTELAPGRRARRCPRCGLEQFPRVAPSMIVAVERGDELLLARSPRFPPGIYSVLAGFVEPGESVEQAVHREVFEETGVEVEDLRYFASQPWPFPHSLMIAFQARYAGGELCVDGEEIEDAGWFRVEQMPAIFRGNVSVAQWLIRDFVERHSGR